MGGSIFAQTLLIWYPKKMAKETRLADIAGAESAVRGYTRVWQAASGKLLPQVSSKSCLFANKALLPKASVYMEHFVIATLLRVPFKQNGIWRHFKMEVTFLPEKLLKQFASELKNTLQLTGKAPGLFFA